MGMEDFLSKRPHLRAAADTGVGPGCQVTQSDQECWAIRNPAVWRTPVALRDKDHICEWYHRYLFICDRGGVFLKEILGISFFVPDFLDFRFFKIF